MVQWHRFHCAFRLFRWFRGWVSIRILAFLVGLVVAQFFSGTLFLFPAFFFRWWPHETWKPQEGFPSFFPKVTEQLRKRGVPQKTHTHMSSISFWLCIMGNGRSPRSRKCSLEKMCNFPGFEGNRSQLACWIYIYIYFRASGSVRRHCPLPFLLLPLFLVSLVCSVVLSPSLCSHPPHPVCMHACT